VGAAGGERRGECAREGGRSGSLEEEAQREVDAEGEAEAGGGLRGEERVAAEGEEVLVGGDERAAQEVSPDGGDDLL
jgi:hypothetical protein